MTPATTPSAPAQGGPGATGTVRAGPTLTALGLSPGAERGYRILLDLPRSSAAELADITHMSPRRVHAFLAELEQSGLLTVVPSRPPRFLPVRPDWALQPLVADRRRELDEIVNWGTELARLLDTSTGSAHPADLIEVIHGPEAILQRTSQLQRAARDEVLIIDRPPYLAPESTAFNSDEIELLAAGVRFRSIYHVPALAIPGHAEQLRLYLEAGEEARALDVSLKMLICDGQRAVVPLSMTERVYRAAVCVHRSPLLDSLITCFEAFWAKATQIDLGLAGTAGPAGDDAAAPSTEDRRLISLLAAGLKDEIIARHLGVSLRTVGRRIDHLMDVLDARSRFQAAVEAGRRGWV